jgi:uncharacterized protein YkwD
VFQDTIATVICAIALTLGLTATLTSSVQAGQAPKPAADDALLAAPGTCAGDDDPEAHHRVQRLAMHCLVAHLRKAAELPRLRSNETLRRSATYKARRIAACKTFTHHPCGDKLDVPFQEAQLTREGRWVVGEDLAWGVGQDATARAILAKWLRSPSHREVLLTKSFSHLGLRRRRLKMQGAPRGAVLWVAHLGRPATR